jgi:hypothetical protein
MGKQIGPKSPTWQNLPKTNPGGGQFGPRFALTKAQLPTAIRGAGESELGGVPGSGQNLFGRLRIPSRDGAECR